MNPKAVCPDLPQVSAEVPRTWPNQNYVPPLSAPLLFTSTCSSSSVSIALSRPSSKLYLQDAPFHDS